MWHKVAWTHPHYGITQPRGEHFWQSTYVQRRTARSPIYRWKNPLWRLGRQQATAAPRHRGRARHSIWMNNGLLSSFPRVIFVPLSTLRPRYNFEIIQRSAKIIFLGWMIRPLCPQVSHATWKKFFGRSLCGHLRVGSSSVGQSRKPLEILKAIW